MGQEGYHAKAATNFQFSECMSDWKREHQSFHTGPLSELHHTWGDFGTFYKLQTNICCQIHSKPSGSGFFMLLSTAKT